MKRMNRLFAACALVFSAVSTQVAAGPPAGSTAGFLFVDGVEVPFEKSALTGTLGARARVTPSATLYGGFGLINTTLVYILVRGNSLGTLGITQSYLDLPRVRVYNGQGQDIAFDVSGNAGFNRCSSSGNTFTVPVYNYYTNSRGQPPHDSDACTSGTLAAGVYTFSVTPSIPGVTTVSTSSTPSSGEVLFEVTLNP